MTAAGLKIVNQLRHLGVKACVLGNEVLVEFATREQFDYALEFYHVERTTVVIGGGECAESAEFVSDGVTFKVSEPPRKPTLRDWTRFREAQS